MTLLSISASVKRALASHLHVERLIAPQNVRDFTRLAGIGDVPPMTRVGGELDGGYLLPDDLDGVVSLVSPGISTEVSFDLAMAKLGLQVFMYDRSVDGPPVRHENFHFEKKFLDTFESDSTVRLDAVTRVLPAGDSMLQMDIEGAEYRVLLDTSSETLARFRIILVEFHDFTRLAATGWHPVFVSVFRKLLANHSIVHIHPNNVSEVVSILGTPIPDCLEFTFLRNDRMAHLPLGKPRIPHPLDRPNVAGRPDLPLPAAWLK